MMKQTSQLKRLVLFILFTAAFLALIPVVVLYSLGYRVSQYKDGFKVTPTGGAYIYYGKPGAKIFVDGEERGETSLFRRGIFIEQLNRGRYEIEVQYEGFRPWKKQMLIEDQRVVEGYPFMVREKIATTSISMYELTDTSSTSKRVPNDEYQTALKLFTTPTSTASTTSRFAFFRRSATTTQVVGKVGSTTASSTPIIPFEILEEKDNVEIHRVGTGTSLSIDARYTGSIENAPSSFCTLEICQEVITVIPYAKDVTAVDFFFDRTDVLIYGTADGIYAVEFDGRTPRNTFKIVDGKNLSFRVYNNTDIVIKDGTNLYTATVL